MRTFKKLIPNTLYRLNQYFLFSTKEIIELHQSPHARERGNAQVKDAVFVLSGDWLMWAGLPATQVGHKVTDFTSLKLEEKPKGRRVTSFETVRNRHVTKEVSNS